MSYLCLITCSDFGSNLNELYHRIPKTERLGGILTEQAYLKIVEQTVKLQVFSAKERYGNLLKKQPDIFRKVQLYHIACYLGIAPKIVKPYP